jgi:F420 biosynthesis protein FbiB-like protein
MTDVFDAIRQRRSIRKYSARPVPQEDIAEILVAAGWAPSAHNAQPWRFIVLADPQVKRKLAEAMAESWSKDMSKDGLTIEMEKFKLRVERFATAPALILACLSMEGMAKFSVEGKQGCERDLAMQSLGAAIENMLLVAHAKGLGACWFCAPVFCKETVRELLKIPEEVEPEALIAMGDPDEQPLAPSRKQLNDFCFKNQWGTNFS